MSLKTYIILQILAILFVIAQPTLGYSSIPSFFNYSTFAAISLGLIDGIIIFLPVFLFAVSN